VKRPLYVLTSRRGFFATRSRPAVHLEPGGPTWSYRRDVAGTRGVRVASWVRGRPGVLSPVPEERNLFGTRTRDSSVILPRGLTR
jgi:hypothetical protein